MEVIYFFKATINFCKYNRRHFPVKQIRFYSWFLTVGVSFFAVFLTKYISAQYYKIMYKQYHKTYSQPSIKCNYNVAMYVQRELKAPLHKHSCRGKKKLLHIECMFLAWISNIQSPCAVLHCHLWPVWLYQIFPHYSINRTIFGKRLSNIKCVFWFSAQHFF